VEKPGFSDWCRNKNFIATIGLRFKALPFGSAFLFRKMAVQTV
jgi:hypothetical protein